MIEYLIRPKEDDWFDFPPGSDPYCPMTIPFRRIEGSVDGGIEIEGCQISFSYEDPGIQVSFAGAMAQEKADHIVEEIRERIQQVSGQAAIIIQISS